MPALALVALLLLPAICAASLLDDDDISYTNPYTGKVNENIDATSNPVHVDGDFEITIGATSITVKALGQVDTPTGVQWIEFSNLDWGSVPGEITDATLNTTLSTILNDDAVVERLSGSSIRLRSGWDASHQIPFLVDETIVADLTVTHPVPEPSTFLLTGLGLGIAGLITRHRRRNAA